MDTSASQNDAVDHYDGNVAEYGSDESRSGAGKNIRG